MAYVDPSTVIAPQNHISSVAVLYDDGDGSWSAAHVIWNGQPQLALRWNGSSDDGKGKGNPQSRGKATWFIVPRELSNAIEMQVMELLQSDDGKLAAGYREMARDADREREAYEWSEALIGDAERSER